MNAYLPKLTERGRRWVRFFALILALGLLVWVALALQRVLTPIVAALALAYILNPLVTMLELRYKIRRAISIGCGLALLLVVGASLLTAATAQVVQLAGNAHFYAEQTLNWLDDAVPGLLSSAATRDIDSESPVANEVSATKFESVATPTSTPVAAQAPPEFDAKGSRLMEFASEHGLSISRTIIGYISHFLSDVFYWISLVFLLPLYTFFFLLEFNTITRHAQNHLPGNYRETVVRVVTTIDQAISSFFRGRLLICLAVGSLTGLGWLALGLFGVRVPYNLALGALAGVLNLVPFMSVLSLPAALILTYMEANAAGVNWVLALTCVVGVYVAVQAIESFVLTPTIGARTSGLHPITTVISLLIGGQLAGVFGMLLAIPIASTLKSLFSEYALPELRRLADLEPGEQPPKAPE